MAFNSNPIEYPALMSVPRLTTLAASLLVTLASGTNYVAYAPQLGTRLQISHTQLNVVGIAGNIGVYISGPVWGRIVDLRGPRILLASAFILLLAGYSGARHIFDSGIPASSTTISTFTFSVLVFCKAMTGAGSNGGLMSAVNSTAKTFPDKARATATGIVLSGLGISAFLFSTIFRVEFPGDTSSFLLLLSLGTSIPMILGYFFIRPVPLPPIERENEVTLYQDSERSSILAPEERITNAALTQLGVVPNLFGYELWISLSTFGSFSLFYRYQGRLVLNLCADVNNVGSISQALYATSTVIYNPIEAARWQADQVSITSLFNCSGRIVLGVVADYGKNRFNLPLSYSLVLVSSLFCISQVIIANIDDVHNLWMASAMTGLAYGSTLSLFPHVCIEWFGMLHFSENWGYLAAAPLVAGNVFSFVFGRTLDSHDTSAADPFVPPAGPVRQCMLGRQCYVHALYLTMGACFLAIVLSGWTSCRYRKMLARRRMMLRRGIDVL
ncbi:major facilitator superfamily domain-containing protein [Lyophyllum atratum]|nr:major facilitator superfamily domain-containing protein [Lyophyllum atratum]